MINGYVINNYMTSYNLILVVFELLLCKKHVSSKKGLNTKEILLLT